MTARKNDISGLTAFQSSDVAIMSAGRSSFRKISPARDVWLPATPTHTPISRSAAIALAERLRLSCTSAPRALGGQVKAGPEVLERLPVIHPERDHSAEHRRERMPGHTQPVRPRPVLPRLVNKRLAHIEHNRTDHPGILRSALTANGLAGGERPASRLAGHRTLSGRHAIIGCPFGRISPERTPDVQGGTQAEPGKTA
jgi:hypothetical protein